MSIIISNFILPTPCFALKLRLASFCACQNYNSKNVNANDGERQTGEASCICCLVAMETVTLSNVSGYSVTVGVVGELQVDSLSMYGVPTTAIP